MNKLEYPNDFWRGIANKDFTCDGHVLPAAFQFDDNVRDDEFKELSINWNDNLEALQKVLEQKKTNGKFQFPVGAANLKLVSVKQFLSLYIEKSEFSYERKEIEGNIYHGNLLVKESVEKPIRSIISNALALLAGTNIEYRKNEDN